MSNPVIKATAGGGIFNSRERTISSLRAERQIGGTEEAGVAA
jgi:hypothetical protein